VIRHIKLINLFSIALLICALASACRDDSPADQPLAVAPSETPTTASAATPTVTASIGNIRRASTSTPTATATATPRKPSGTPEPQVASTPVQVEAAPPPVRLRIPAIELDTTVQWVGVDSEGRMGIPSNYTDVAWYEDGPTPGTPGNAVIAGHLDSKTGPAVFYRLEDLVPGDEIITATADGQELRFIVLSSETYDVADAPLERIFGNADRPHLNLITCDGAFDRSIRQYDKRLVVYTELVTN
jgi:sortase (surface protein transpeptidase)